MTTGNHETLVHRLAQMLIKLNQGEKLDPQALADEFAVNLRTIQRDLNERFSYLPLVKTEGRYHLDPLFLGKLSTRDIERFAGLAGVRGLFPSLSDAFLKDIFDAQLQSTFLVKGHHYEDLSDRRADFQLLEQAISAHRHILLLMLISWVGVLDKVSGDYVDGALAKAVVAFGTARAINGAISVAQSTTVSVGFGAGVEVSPGEILDPINDLVEDYSSAMKLAIASLVIQKILLAVVSETVFKVLLTLSGLALIASLLLKVTAPMNFLFKVFVSLVFLRFVLVAVVVLNGLVNHAFIDDRRDEVTERLNVLPGDLEQLRRTELPEESLGEELAQLEGELGIARSSLQESRQQLEAANSGRSLTDMLNPFRDDPAHDAAAAAVKAGETEVNALLVRRCEAMRRAEDMNADAACAEVPLSVRAATRAASAGQAVSRIARAAVATFDFSKLQQRLEGAVKDMVTAMALFILQTMILPLLFLFALSKATKSIWGMDLKEVVAKAKAAAGQGPPTLASGPT